MMGAGVMAGARARAGIGEDGERTGRYGGHMWENEKVWQSQ
jgi:hypothetical protein